MGIDPTVSQREIGSTTQKSKGGLLCDCTTSQINRFAALVGSRGGGEKVPRRDQEYSSACFSAGRGAESSALVTPTSTFTITNINNQCRGSDLGVGSVLPLPAKIQVIYPGINLEL